MRQKIKATLEWIIISIQWLVIRKYAIRSAIGKCNGNKDALLQLKNNLYLVFFKQYPNHWTTKEFTNMIDKGLYETEA